MPVSVGEDVFAVMGNEELTKFAFMKNILELVVVLTVFLPLHPYIAYIPIARRAQMHPGRMMRRFLKR